MNWGSKDNRGSHTHWGCMHRTVTHRESPQTVCDPRQNSTACVGFAVCRPHILLCARAVDDSLSVPSILLLLLAGATAYIFLRVRQEQASIRSWLARSSCRLPSRPECTRQLRRLLPEGLCSLRRRMLNPSPPPGDQNWSREMFAECASIVCEYDAGRVSAASFLLSASGSFSCERGCDFASAVQGTESNCCALTVSTCTWKRLTE